MTCATYFLTIPNITQCSDHRLNYVRHITIHENLFRILYAYSVIIAVHIHQIYSLLITPDMLIPLFKQILQDYC